MHQQVEKIITDHLGLKQPLATSDVLTDDLGADSLDIVEMAIAIESELGIRIPDDEFERWQTVRDVIDTVNQFTG